MNRIHSRIRDIPDFPKPGILFKDITPVLSDPLALREAVALLSAPFVDGGLTAVVGMEARGFIFGALVAQTLGVGFVPLRKPGKLPATVRSIAYDLEYGSATLEVHADALNSDDRVLIVDDLLATGGTAAASCELVEALGARVSALAFMVELKGLGGREKLAPYSIHRLLEY